MEVKNLKKIGKGWDLKIKLAIDTERNPVYDLTINKGEGSIRIKTNKKIWI